MHIPIERIAILLTVNIVNLFVEIADMAIDIDYFSMLVIRMKYPLNNTIIILMADLSPWTVGARERKFI